MITLAIHGTNTRDMERLAAIPLEDALSGIAGINRIVTFSENSLVRAFVNFKDNSAGRYDALREAAQKIYETMPPWAQRPTLSSSDDSRIPVWTAAVLGCTGDYLEKVIKPGLEGLEGTGEVEIAGTGINEIVIVPDPEKCALMNISPEDIAVFLAENDGIFPGGKLKSEGREFLVKIDGRFQDSVSLGEAWISFNSGKAVKLKDIALITEREKEEKIISRLDGEKTAVISIQAASGTELGVLSRRIKKELEKYGGENRFRENSSPGSAAAVEFKILRDLGAEEDRAFRSVLTATAQATILVALCAVLLARKKRSLFSALVCALSIPFIAAVSAAVLSRLGLAVNRKLLAGLSIGIGAAADAVILCAEAFGNRNNSGGEGKTMAKLLPPLVSGAATTIAALFPLARFSESEDMTVIAAALGTVTLVSLAASVSVLPPLFLWKNNYPADSIKTNKSVVLTATGLFYRFGNYIEIANSFIKYSQKSIRRKLKRLLSILIRICLERPLLPSVCALVTVILGIAVIINAGIDVSETGNGDSIYARIEFDGGFHREEGDKLLAVWTNKIKNHDGIVSIQTSTRTGSAQIIINFDPKIITEIKTRELIRSSYIPRGFIHIPEAAQSEQNWEISISGDDDSKCRKIAQEAAFLCSSLPEVIETILNFKSGNPRLSLVPQRDIIAEESLSFFLAGDTVRRAIHGPVIYKRPGEKGETDVRLKLRGEDSSCLEKIMDIPVIKSRTASNYSASKPGNRFIQFRDNEASAIRRENRRRTASFSIKTSPMDPRKIRDKIHEATKNIELSPGYVLEFDRDAIEKAEAMSGTIFRFMLALIFCYMAIAAANESLHLPLIVLSAVPPSLALPVLILVLSGSAINSAVCCSLVAVSGITVNASVIVTGEFTVYLKTGKLNETDQYYRIIRKCLPCLLAVCGTTMAGALPFLFLRGASNSMIRILSTVTFLGVGASFCASLTLVPSLIKLMYLYQQKITASGNKRRFQNA